MANYMNLSVKHLYVSGSKIFIDIDDVTEVSDLSACGREYDRVIPPETTFVSDDVQTAKISDDDSSEERDDTMRMVIQIAFIAGIAYALCNALSNTSAVDGCNSMTHAEGVPVRQKTLLIPIIEGYEMGTGTTQGTSVVQLSLDIPHAAFGSHTNVIQNEKKAMDGDNTGDDEKDLMDEMLTDVLEMNVNNMANKAKKDSDSDSD
eukprot:203095_1